MSSKRGVRRKQCGDNVKFVDRAAAERRRRVMQVGRLDRLSSYCCRWCGAWHIGHTPASVIQRMRAQQAARGD